MIVATSSPDGRFTGQLDQTHSQTASARRARCLFQYAHMAGGPFAECR